MSWSWMGFIEFILGFKVKNTQKNINVSVLMIFYHEIKALYRFLSKRRNKIDKLNF